MGTSGNFQPAFPRSGNIVPIAARSARNRRWGRRSVLWIAPSKPPRRRLPRRRPVRATVPEVSPDSILRTSATAGHPTPTGTSAQRYYIQTVNTSVGIFRKSDGVMVAGFSFDTLMSQGNFGNACDSQNFGDPTVVWDPGADRWIISDFAFTLNAGNPVAPYFQCFAVSRTGDPVTGGWNFYALETSDLFPDYPKVGVWPDALYLTANMFAGNTFKNVRVWALNKAQMYAGTGASAVTFNLPAKVQGVSVFTGIPSTYHTVTGTPPAGRPNFISVIWSSKLARIWKFHVDWNNTANSTLTGPSNVTLATWGVGRDVRSGEERERSRYVA